MSAPDPDPFALFAKWMAEAEKSEPNDPNAMAVSTVDDQGRPSCRMVLLKGWDADGFVFYTNLDSRKSTEIRGNANVALLFHWKSLKRQIRIEGIAAPVSDDEADAYYASRPRISQIGAWASLQSRPLEGRFELEKRVAEFTAKFGLGDIPRTALWSAWRVSPRALEFWHDRPFRLHDRFRYERDGAAWGCTPLFP